jgi:hypothetical protein
VRRERPNTIDELLRRSGRVELTVLGPDLLRVRRALLGLRLEARLVLREHIDQKLRSDLGRARVDGAGVVVRGDREGALRGDRPGVERLDRAVDRDAGLLVPGHQRALHGSGPAPARQQ